jgi:hypothetical protein
MTEAPREGDSRRQGDPLEDQIVDEQLAGDRAAQPIVSEGSPNTRNTTAPGGRPGVNDASSATDDAVAARAYELYQARGGTHGADMDDWLQAEREVREEREQGDRGPSDEPDNPAHRPID